MSESGASISAVTVFCGSSDAVAAKYFRAAEELGEKMARRDWRLVYGGGRVGLMGVLSRSVLEHGGHVTGVIPRALLDLGVGETKVSELVVTDGLRDRKAIMDERGDAFVALPGGIGTLEEVLEALTLKQLGYRRARSRRLLRSALDAVPAGGRVRLYQARIPGPLVSCSRRGRIAPISRRLRAARLRTEVDGSPNQPHPGLSSRGDRA